MRVFTDKGTVEEVEEIGAYRPEPDAKCKCGNDAFRISYGDYVCNGTCTKCGEVTELYSG